jgi:hypothetical protein
MGAYAIQGRMAGGRPTYKGGSGDDMSVWYVANHGNWVVAPAAAVGTAGGFSERYPKAFMSVEDSAATPDAVQGTWKVSEGFKYNSSVTVTQIAGSILLLPRNRTTDLGCCFAGGSGIRISGLPSNHYSARILGDYTKQPGTEGGRPTYKGGVGGSMGMWYSADKGFWRVGPADRIGMNGCSMFAKASTAATPDAVPVGTWMVGDGFQPPITAVKCTRS